MSTLFAQNCLSEKLGSLRDPLCSKLKLIKLSGCPGYPEFCLGVYVPLTFLSSDFIWPFLPPYKGVIHNVINSLKNFPKCKGKGSFPKSQIKSLLSCCCSYDGINRFHMMRLILTFYFIYLYPPWSPKMS